MFNFFKRKKPVYTPVIRTRKELREIKWERLQRRKLRWCILRHYILLDNISHTKNIYELKKHLKDWYDVKDIFNHVEDFKINKHDFEVIRRFILREQYLGICDYEEMPVITLENYESLILNPEKYLLTAYDNYESYCDSLINHYRRSSDKKERLEYIIETLTGDLSNTLISYGSVELRIRGLIHKYNKELETLESNL